MHFENRGLKIKMLANSERWGKTLARWIYLARCHSYAVIYHVSYISIAPAACGMNFSCSIVSIVSPVLFAPARPENHLIFVEWNERDRGFCEKQRVGEERNDMEQLHLELHAANWTFRHESPASLSPIYCSRIRDLLSQYIITNKSSGRTDLGSNNQRIRTTNRRG